VPSLTLSAPTPQDWGRGRPSRGASVVCQPPWDPTEKGLYVDDPQAAGSAAEVRRLQTDIGWGHHIRSYVLDQSRIKDLRTNYEVSNTQAVLDGDLDDFIAASLKQGV
jgi:peptide chain release factor 2